MRDPITTALDVLGLLLVAAGVVFFLWPSMGGGSLAVGGGLILLASVLAASPLAEPAKTKTRRKRDGVGEEHR